MIEKLQKMRAEKGFTLAELLVVVLIIGILATLAIVFFTGRDDNARDTVATGNIRSAFSSAQSEYTEGNGSYPAITTLVSNMRDDGVDAEELATAATAAPADPAVGVFVAGNVITLKAEGANGDCVGTNSGGPFEVTCP